MRRGPFLDYDYTLVGFCFGDSGVLSRLFSVNMVLLDVLARVVLIQCWGEGGVHKYPLECGESFTYGMSKKREDTVNRSMLIDRGQG